jgi:hypothetical protein
MMLKRASGELANGLVPDMSIRSAYSTFNYPKIKIRNAYADFDLISI